MQICSYGPCDRPIITIKSGLCSTHYAQVRAGRSLSPIRVIARFTNPRVRDEQGCKRCLRCTTWKSEVEFCKNVHCSDNLHYLCKSCARAQKHLERYGVTPEQVDELHREQGGRCRICQVHEDDLVIKRLYVDHDHDHCSKRQGCPDCVRGLLCMRCNSTIGFMDESPDRLIAAAEYLRATRSTDAGVAAA